jgi:hypothetical protein
MSPIPNNSLRPLPAQGFRVFSFLRFSNPAQASGDSEHRQLEATLEYCAARGWTLDETLVDRGKSAGRGRHMQKGGSLRRFFDQVEAGLVRPGDKFIFEGFDRFDRRPPRLVMPNFLELINRRIEVHVIHANAVFSIETIDENEGLLYSVLSAMWGAHRENRAKGKRVKAAWRARRSHLTYMTPAWIRPDHDRLPGGEFPPGTKFELIPEYVAVIEYIFRLVIAGHGFDKITRILNAEQIPAFRRAVIPGTIECRRPVHGWHHSYVRSLVVTRRVLGEVELCESIEGADGKIRSVKTGEIRKIYPAAISEALWREAQDARRQGVAGRKGDEFTNLLSGVARCVCGASMHYVSKGTRSSFKYLQCSGAKRGVCNYRRLHRYQQLEERVLTIFGEYAHGPLPMPEDPTAGLQAQIADLKRDADELERQYNREADVIGRGKTTGLGAKRLASLEAQHGAKLAQIAELEKQLKAARNGPSVDEQITAVRALIAGLDGLPVSQRYATRARINAGLRGFLTVTCKPSGDVLIRLGTPNEREPRTLVVTDLVSPGTAQLTTMDAVLAALRHRAAAAQ